jgi:hypothetical protein
MNTGVRTVLCSAAFTAFVDYTIDLVGPDGLGGVSTPTGVVTLQGRKKNTLI